MTWLELLKLCILIAVFFLFLSITVDSAIEKFWSGRKEAELESDRRRNTRRGI